MAFLQIQIHPDLLRSKNVTFILTQVGGCGLRTPLSGLGWFFGEGLGYVVFVKESVLELSQVLVWG